MLVILGTLVFFAVCGPSQAALSDDYAHNQRLDGKNESEPTYTLYWTYNKADSTMSFAAKAKAKGWVGLGFTTKSDNTTTYDVVRGSYDDFAASGTPKEKIFDFHAVGKQTLVKDTQQNLMNASVSESGAYTTIKFKRALDTKDSNDTVIKPGPMIVVWLYGNTDLLESGVQEMGYKTVTFFQEEQKNDTSTAEPTTPNPESKAVACQGSWLLLSLSALLFILPGLAP